MRELGLGCLYLAFFAMLFAAIANTRAVVRLLRQPTTGNGNGKKKGKDNADAPLNLHAPRLAMLFATVCLLTAGAAMIHCIWNHRFDLGYVYSYTSLKLAKPFRISALWNGQEGTYLLWCMYLGLWGLLLLGKRNVLATLFPVAGKVAPPITPLREPFVTAVHNWVLVGMMLLLLVRSPFHFIGPKEKWKGFMDLLKTGGDAHLKALPKDPDAFFNRHGIKLIRDGEMPRPEFVEGKTDQVLRLMGFTGAPEPLVMPSDGNGMNELLQNPWMCIHPVIMFIGFSAMGLPFIFALAALIKRDYQSWIHEAFPFLIFPWAFLGTGLTLGGAWAYGVLGWHGYWAWDPVENASLFPWITATALIHGMVLQRRAVSGGGFGRANFSLAILVHLLVLYGTFLTRSGILSDASVHSFTSEGNELYWTLVLVGGVTIMASYGITPLLPLLSILFVLNRSGYASRAAKGEIPNDAVSDLVLQTGVGIVIGLLVCVASWMLLSKAVARKPLSRRMLLFGLLGDRWAEIRADAQYENVRSRDFAVFLGVIALVSSAAVVTLGTSSPVVMTMLNWSSSAIKEKYEGVVQQSFYNYAHMPIGLTMMLMMGLWRYLPWNGGTSERLRRHLPKHVAVALVITAVIRSYLGFTEARSGAAPLISALQWVVIGLAVFAFVANANLGFGIGRAIARSAALQSRAGKLLVAGVTVGALLGTIAGFVIATLFGAGATSIAHMAVVTAALGGLTGAIAGSNAWRSGAFIAHMGVAMLFVGTIISSAYEETEKLQLPLGREVKGFGDRWTYKLTSEDVNARRGDTRYLWERDHLIIQYWLNSGRRQVRTARPIVSLNNVGQMINVPFIKKQTLRDWYFAAGHQGEDARGSFDAVMNETDIRRATESKAVRPFIRVTSSNPAQFNLLPGHRFELKGYRAYRDKTGDNPLIGLVINHTAGIGREPGKMAPASDRLERNELIARVEMRGPERISAEPVAVPGTPYHLLIDSRSEDEGTAMWGLRLTNGSKWLKNLPEYGEVTSENSAEFPGLPGWKFVMADAIRPEGMGTPDWQPTSDSQIGALIEVTHGGKTHTLKPMLRMMGQRQIRVSVPGTPFQLALEAANPTTKRYLVSLVHTDMKPYWVVEVTHKPLINFVWLGVGVMVLGGLMSLKHRSGGNLVSTTE